MSVRDSIARWRAEFRQGVADVQWGPRHGFDAGAPPAGDGSRADRVQRDAGSGSGWRDPHEQAPHDPLFEHLVTLCEEQEVEIAALRAELAQTAARRDGDQAILAQLRELESIFVFPGVMTALLKVLHPDTADAADDVHARTDIFQTLMAVRSRLAGRQ